MAGGKVTGLVLLVAWRNVLTFLGRIRTSRVEETSTRRISGGGDISLEHDTVHLNVRVRLGNRREERLGVRMQRIVKYILLISELDHRAEVHNSDLIRDEFNYGEIVRDEEISEVH